MKRQNDFLAFRLRKIRPLMALLALGHFGCSDAAPPSTGDTGTGGTGTVNSTMGSTVSGSTTGDAATAGTPTTSSSTSSTSVSTATTDTGSTSTTSATTTTSGAGGSSSTTTTDMGGATTTSSTDVAAGGTAGTGGSPGEQHWVGSWASGPQLTETNNNPPSPGLSGNTLRQVVFPTLSGSRIRVRLSNEFGNGSVTMNSVHIAASTSGSAIDTGTDTELSFGGMASVTIAQGEAVWSDPLDYALPALEKVAITIAFGDTPSGITGHPGSRTTSYLESGQMPSAASLDSAATAEHWYYISGIDVMASAQSAAIAILGDSITDGRGSTTDANNRWPDNLARRLQADAGTSHIAVLNLGIGGNAVVSGGLGPTAEARFERDILNQSAVKWVIVFEGVNDIGGAGSSVTNGIISAFQQFISDSHAAGLSIYGVPITPFGGSQYDSSDHESARQAVNDWIRTSGEFDDVIDLDAAVRDPNDTTHLLASYDSGDFLHLSVAGYQAMADSIDLSLFQN